MRNIVTSSNVHSLPLTDLIYGLLGLSFLRHKDEGFTRLARDRIYSVLRTLAERYPVYFPNVYFTEHGSLMHSKQVEDVLFRLGGVIAVENPRYQYVGFNENELAQVESKLQKWFTAEKRKIVEALAEEFYRELQ